MSPHPDEHEYRESDNDTADYRWSRDHKDERVNLKPKGNVIGLNDNMQDVIVKMSKGNIGAATVLMKILEAKGDMDGVVTILHLDDQQVRGEQIWLWYKDVFGEDVNKLIDAAWGRKLKVLSYEEATKLRNERFEREAKEREALR